MSFPLRKPVLDGASSEPLYQQVSAWLRTGIERGRLLPGDRLPATRDLASLLKLNRATVSAAYNLLASEGLVSGHVGKGSFVAIRTKTNFQSAAPSGRSPLVSFNASRPSAELFPVDAFEQSCKEVLVSAEISQILQLGSPHGYAPLRRYLLARAQDEGKATDSDDILITSGCQQGFDLLQRYLLAGVGAEPVRIAIEDPVYPGIEKAFSQPGAEIERVSALDPAQQFEQIRRLRSQGRLAAWVATPCFQNPTGNTMPLELRRELLDAAASQNSLIVENDIYSGLRYRGDAIPSLKSLGGERVVTVNSFSKVAFPGLRVGWVVGPKAVISHLAAIRHWCDLHTDQLSQAVLLRFAESGRLADHCARMIAAGRERLDAALGAFRAYLPKSAGHTRPEGGMNIWITLPAGFDAESMLEESVRRGVSYLPGTIFSKRPEARHSLRLSFAGLTPAEIDSGVRILATLFEERLGVSPLSSVMENESALV